MIFKNLVFICGLIIYLSTLTIAFSRNETNIYEEVFQSMEHVSVSYANRPVKIIFGDKVVDVEIYNQDHFNDARRLLTQFDANFEQLNIYCNGFDVPDDFFDGFSSIVKFCFFEPSQDLDWIESLPGNIASRVTIEAVMDGLNIISSLNGTVVGPSF